MWQHAQCSYRVAQLANSKPKNIHELCIQLTGWTLQMQSSKGSRSPQGEWALQNFSFKLLQDFKIFYIGASFLYSLLVYSVHLAFSVSIQQTDYTEWTAACSAFENSIIGGLCQSLGLLFTLERSNKWIISSCRLSLSLKKGLPSNLMFQFKSTHMEKK